MTEYFYFRCTANKAEEQEPVAWEDGDMQGSWASLIYWCLAEDQCEEVWKRLRPHYAKAISLREDWKDWK